MERSFLDDVGAVAVFADQLEEQGDPHAELVRAQLAGDALRARELIRTHGPQWLGPIEQKESLLTWKRGFVVDAAFRRIPVEGSLAAFLQRPALRFLQRLAFGPSAKVAMLELEGAQSLRALVWLTSSLAPLADLKLQSLEALTIDLGTHEVGAMSSMHLPALRELDTRCAPGREDALVRGLASAGWWRSLQSWTHRFESPAGLSALRACGPLVERGGRGLLALCVPSALEQVTPELRRTLPHAEFKLFPVPEKPFDPEDSNGPAEVSVTPVEGRMDFRDLAHPVHASKDSIQNSGTQDTAMDGPGEPFKDGREFTSCGWCGGTETRRIHSNSWSLYSHYETTSYERWEYECLQCRLFTRMRSSYTR